MPKVADPKAPDAVVLIRDFGGWESNADPHDVAPGVAVIQVNVTSVKRGELRGRLGYMPLKFEE